MSQRTPDQASVQKQVKLESVNSQIPPFEHGSDSHGLSINKYYALSVSKYYTNTNDKLQYLLQKLIGRSNVF